MGAGFLMVALTVVLGANATLAAGEGKGQGDGKAEGDGGGKLMKIRTQVMELWNKKPSEPFAEDHIRVVTEAMQANEAWIRKIADADRDGKLSEAERKTVLKALRETGGGTRKAGAKGKAKGGKKP